MEMARYFVTKDGLIASFADQTVLNDITRVLEGDAPDPVVQQYLQRGIIEHDRRPAREVDHNKIVLSGVLEQLRDAGILAPTTKTNGHTGHARPKTPHPHQDDEDVRDLRTVPRKLYRLSKRAAGVTTTELRKLPAASRHVFAALRQSDVGTTKTLTEMTGLNRRTVENGLSALRKAGYLDDMDFNR